MRCLSHTRLPGPSLESIYKPPEGPEGLGEVLGERSGVLGIQLSSIGHLGLAGGSGDAAHQTVGDLGASWAGLPTDRRGDSVRGDGVQPFGVVQVRVCPGDQQNVCGWSRWRWLP